MICARAFDFGIRIIGLCTRMSTGGLASRQIAFQLLRCGTSIGANAEEAQDGQTKPDYIAKMAVARKESRETRYWLRLAVGANIVTPTQVAWELNEADELRRMIVAAIRTAQSNPNRGHVDE
jgi:four helix bundle protein